MKKSVVVVLRLRQEERLAALQAELHVLVVGHVAFDPLDMPADEARVAMLIEALRAHGR